jgi:hypothetical protein
MGDAERPKRLSKEKGKGEEAAKAVIAVLSQ